MDGHDDLGDFGPMPVPPTPRDSFWLVRGQWPPDPPGQIFLGRALIEAGPRILGDRWHLKIMTVDPIRPIPESPWLATVEDVHLVMEVDYRLTQKERGLLGPLGEPGVVGPSDYVRGLREKNWTIEDQRLQVTRWRWARRRTLRELAPVLMMLVARAELIDWIGVRAKQGTISLFGRSQRGGSSRAIAPASWPGSDEAIERLFQRCAMDGPAGELGDGDYLFLDAAQFREALAHHDASLSELPSNQAVIATDAPLAPLKPAPAVTKRQARSAYRARVANWPEGKRGPSPAADHLWLKEGFGLGREYARLLRREEAPESWHATGVDKQPEEDEG